MNKFYQIVSAVFIPLLMPTYGMLLFFLLPELSNTTTTTKILITFSTFMLTSFLPFALIYGFQKKGLVSDLYISNRKERPIPFLFILAFYISWIYFLWINVQRIDLPSYMLILSIGVIISILLLAVISLIWKISAHTSGIGSLTGAVFAICTRLDIYPIALLVILLLLSALVARARIKLKAHTPAQAIAGFVLGFTSLYFYTFFIP